MSTPKQLIPLYTYIGTAICAIRNFNGNIQIMLEGMMVRGDTNNDLLTKPLKRYKE